MSSNEVYLLSFLEDSIPAAAYSAKKMEELIFEDASSSIIKGRLFAEEILSEVFKIEKLEVPYQSSLYDKINILTREEIINRDIQQAFDTIRLSGNKAAHNANFNDITEAFKLHKEMYKVGVWFVEVYSSGQLKIPPYEAPKPKNKVPQKEEFTELINKQILELLGLGKLDNVQKANVVNKDPKETETIKDGKSPETLIKKDLAQGESYLMRELRRLKESSQEAIENANHFSSFKDYMHVDRKIQLDLEEILERNKGIEKGSLILLCGSVGDGKSHLLAYLKEKKPELISDYKIFNDATESFSPNKNSIETLEEVLSGFSDENLEYSNDKIILAINMGVLNNFIHSTHEKHSYYSLKAFVERSELFTQNITTHYSEGSLSLLSFADYHTYELTETGARSSFFSCLLEKLLNKSDQNPFYVALKEDQKNYIENIVHVNYKFLQNQFVQDQIVQLVTQTIVKKKLVISARAFLNFISDILVPDNVNRIEILSDFEVLNHSLPTLLFNRRERSSILNAMSELDPIHCRSVHIDQLIIKLNTLGDWGGPISEYVNDVIGLNWLTPFMTRSDLTEHSFTLFFESLIRIAFLSNKDFAANISDQDYKDYIENLYSFNVVKMKKISHFYEEILSAIFKWKGSPKKDYIYLSKPSDKYRLAQKLKPKPTVEHLSPNTNEVLDTFKSSIVIGYNNGNSENNLFIEIDFQLYSLLKKVVAGYRPNKRDEEDAIKFMEFMEKLMEFGEKKEEMLIHFPRDNKFYMVKRDSFGAFAFERE
ncbi:DNA phosphorothioation-dependent restriction protein DptF [Mesobacillus jeotgali]|uniref:DNA phosphorothioation-dependent restriction protein DptF n=1 Tax=Mesobacillus jeotgali TaxID=129985 RepID=UPI00178560F6|nr:DNA phosphorothioation-dependent restriction protein DptF [Mesobacillus jeotgali]UYZ24024.1 DNA phosphorothioation-dependent restriction protein DptF [Mesobacillus jeotgali]